MSEPQTAATPPAPSAPPSPAPAPAASARSTGLTAAQYADLGSHGREAYDRAAEDRSRNVGGLWTRAPDGSLLVNGKPANADGTYEPGSQGDRPGTEATAPDPNAERFKFGDDLELTQQEIKDLIVHKAESDLRSAQVPPTAADYKLELPKDLKLPAGVEFKLASDNDPVKGPALQAARDWAARNKLSQAQFSELLGLYASTTAHEQITISNAHRAEVERLGVTGPARIDAITRWLAGHYGAQASRSMRQTFVTEAQVRIWEDVIQHRTNGGGAGFSQRGREPPDPPTISDEAYEKMNYSQRLEYARDATARAGNHRRW